MSNPHSSIIRQRFLEQASESLQERSFSSADVCRHDAILLHRQGNASKSKSVRHCCPACGSLSIEEKHVPAMRKGASKPGKPADGAEQFVLLRKCRICSRTAKILKSPSSEPKSQPPTMRLSTTEDISTAVKGDATTENASGARTSSKKRAKERRNREGLRAMLDKNQNAAKSPGFSLMDFMSGTPK